MVATHTFLLLLFIDCFHVCMFTSVCGCVCVHACHMCVFKRRMSGIFLSLPLTPLDKVAMNQKPAIWAGLGWPAVGLWDLPVFMAPCCVTGIRGRLCEFQGFELRSYPCVLYPLSHLHRPPSVYSPQPFHSWMFAVLRFPLATSQVSVLRTFGERMPPVPTSAVSSHLQWPRMDGFL